jgi:hypothetical protein
MKTITNYLNAELPVQTRSYTPVGHAQLIDFVEERLDTAGFKRTSLNVDQNIDGTVIIANMSLAHQETTDFLQEFSIINSYDKSKPVTFASGARVFVCSNGMIISDAVTVRKHTTNVWNEMAEKADIAIKQLQDNWEKTQHDVALMKDRRMTFRKMSETLGRIFIEKQILLSTEVNTAVRELRKPTFEDFSGMNLWSLYNACTFALKEAHVSRKNTSLKQLHDFCTEIA